MNKLEGLSPSSVELWEQCPKKFYEQKMMGRSGGTSESALMGTFVHLVLEKLMQLPAKERTIDRTRLIATQSWEEFTGSQEWTSWVEETGFNDTRGFKEKSWHSINGYHGMENPKEVEVVATERFMSATIEGVPVRGIIDRLDSDVLGGTVVVDYKTGKVSSPAFQAPKIRQLNIYAALVEEVDGKRPDEARLLFTTFSWMVDTKVTAKSVNSAVETLSRVWSEIDRALQDDAFEAKAGALCGWCPFVAECPEGATEVQIRMKAGRLKPSAPAWDLIGGKALDCLPS